jgi:flavin reductase ActVB
MTSAASDTRSAQNAIGALYESYNRHDAMAAARLYAEMGTHEDVAHCRVAEGPETIREGLERFFAAFPDARWRDVRVFGHGDRATASYTLTGTLQQRLGPFEAAGQPLSLNGVQVVETQGDGRIAHSIDYWDGNEFVRQMRRDADAGDVDVQPLPVLDPPAIAPDGFRQAMRLLAGGVAVVTTIVDGRPWGLTVSACCSLTADPPKVLISLDSRTTSCRAIFDNGRFGVALLGSDQVAVARICSAAGLPKFIEEIVDHSFAQVRSPVIAGALAHLDCRVVDSHRVGDHALIIGLVQDALSPRTHEDFEPLVYFQRAFRTVGTALA